MHIKSNNKSISAAKHIGLNEAASMENLYKGKVNDSEHVLVPKMKHKDLGDIESIIEYETNLWFL